MNVKQTFRIRVLAAALAALLAGCAAMQQTPIDQTSTEDGLQKVKNSSFDAVYRKPKADLSKYDKLLLRPVEVAFRKDWDPGRDSALYAMHKPDREKIKQAVAENFVDVFQRELQAGGYQ